MTDFMKNGASDADAWVVPVIQGFVQIEPVPLDTPDTNTEKHNAMPGDFYSLCLISRRSRHRAGTRYKRRGVDEDGYVANYVETEQLVTLNTHVIAYVQVRGSVPVYWSQPGYKYRPPPRLDKGEEETQAAFTRHFSHETERYKHVVCISLIEQAGKEKVISDAYTSNILKLNSPNLTYVTFDFHEYCRGLRYENVSVLVEGLSTVLQNAGYCWVDKHGVICTQRSVCRTNCIDCLDRTNVVQTAMGRAVLERQFVKLGLLSPDHPLPNLCRSALNTMWANNGDALSRQYAGTQALKGDFTRTGERKLSSLMKDGMNSANRYYMNRFRDAYRQATIDTMLGAPVSAELLHLDSECAASATEEEEDDANAVAQHVKSVIDDATILLVPDAHTVLGAWGLIDADHQTGDPEQMDMDTILVLTRDSYYVAQYDEASDRITNYQRVSLIDLDCIEIGQYSFPSVFKQSRVHHCLRLCYQVDKQPGYFHTLRSMNIRFFNNLAVTIKTEEERVESIKSIGETFEVGGQLIGCDAPLHLLPRLEKRRNKGRSQLLNPLSLFSQPLASFTKPSPDSFKSAGSRAFSNVTSGLARLNPISNFKRHRNSSSRNANSTFYTQKPIVSIEYLQEGEPTSYMFPEIHLSCCGVLASSVTTQAHHGSVSTPHPPSSPLTRSISEGYITARHAAANLSPPMSPLPTNRSLTPEICISECLEAQENVQRQHLGPISISAATAASQQLTALVSQKVRKLSHSSDEVDPRDGSSSSNQDTVYSDGSSSILRASSATDLQLHMPSSRSEGGLQHSSAAFSVPASPLAAFQKDGMFGAPLNALAKGMQSLAPGAGKLARGMQSIGANTDPKKLMMQRQKLAEEDLIWQAKKSKCRSVIIDF
uniref:Phosphatidylinositide phosphatase SAC2-like n=1 Tax=Hirondellea gigas TaxID=1518452 RepID=A0A2P2I941_9CRUS